MLTFYNLPTPCKKCWQLPQYMVEKIDTQDIKSIFNLFPSRPFSSFTLKYVIINGKWKQYQKCHDSRYHKLTAVGWKDLIIFGIIIYFWKQYWMDLITVNVASCDLRVWLQTNFKLDLDLSLTINEPFNFVCHRWHRNRHKQFWILISSYVYNLSTRKKATIMTIFTVIKSICEFMVSWIMNHDIFDTVFICH